MDVKFAIIASALSDDPREAPRLARRAGFHGLQYDAFGTRLRIPDLSLSGRRDFRHMLATHDQDLAGLRVDTGAKGLASDADIDRILARLDTAMDAAAGLNARLLCVDLCPLPEPPPTEKPKPKVTPEQAGLLILPDSITAPTPIVPASPASPADSAAISAVDSAMFELGRRADRYGVTLAFRSDLASFAAVERALAAASCPWFGLDLDPAAILRDAWTTDELFSRLGPLIRHVRARDALASGARTKPAPIGEGNVNWEELFAALDDTAYRGWITIDPLELPDRPTAATQALSHLRPFLRQ
jgi:sugar phosphate isomerase/epimerase